MRIVLSFLMAFSLTACSVAERLGLPRQSPVGGGSVADDVAELRHEIEMDRIQRDIDEIQHGMDRDEAKFDAEMEKIQRDADIEEMQHELDGGRKDD